MNDERLRNTDDIRNEMAYRDANNASMYDLCEDILYKLEQRDAEIERLREDNNRLREALLRLHCRSRQ